MSPKTRNMLLWTAQVVLAALFLFAGGFKLALPFATLAKLSPLPAAFLKFIGACEAAGALGLVLPGLLNMQRGLTPVAAAGLIVIMLGAVLVTVATQGVRPAVPPLLIGAVLAVVLLGRRQWARWADRALSGSLY